MNDIIELLGGERYTQVAKVVVPASYDIEAYKQGYPHDVIIITKETLEALLVGKILGFMDGEYNHFIIYQE